jgi:hypothetical protein
MQLKIKLINNEMMKAKELIRLLEKLPPDMKIVVRGYEEGYNDIIELKPLQLKHKQDAEWYYGEYLKSEDPDSIEAIELYGENKNKGS